MKIGQTINSLSMRSLWTAFHNSVIASWRRWVRNGWRGIQLLILLLVASAIGFYWVKQNAPQVNPALFGFTRTFTMLTGQTSKEYHRVGGMLAYAVNARAAELGIRLVIRPSKGTSYNMDAVIAGEADLGFISAQQFYPGPAARQQAQYLHNETKVLSQLYTSMFTLMASESSKIERLDDLKGKRVGVLNFSSTDRSALIDVLAASEMSYWIPPDERKGGIGAGGPETPGPDDVTIAQANLAKMSRWLKQGSLDAFFLTSVHPSPLIRRYLLGSKLHFVPLIVNMERLRGRSPAYYETTIAVANYAAGPDMEDVATLGSRTMLVASNNLPEDVAYGIVMALYESTDLLKATPLAQDVSGPSMVDGLAVEDMHPGALRFFQERRLLTRAHRLANSEKSEPPLLVFLNSDAVERLVEGVDAPEPGGSDGLVKLARATASDLTSPMLNHVVTNRYSMALLGAQNAQRQPASREEALNRLATNSIRSVCRLPGELAQFIVSDRYPTAHIAEMGGLRVGTVQGDARAGRLLDWIDQQLLKVNAAYLIRSEYPKERLVEAYLGQQIDALLVFDAAPSALLNSILLRPIGEPSRPFHLVGLEPLRAGDPGPDGLLPAVIKANLYPEIQNEEVPAWLEPLTLLANARLPAVTVQKAMMRLIERARTLSVGATWDSTALLTGLEFPVHEGVLLAKDAIFRLNPSQTSSAPAGSPTSAPKADAPSAPSPEAATPARQEPVGQSSTQPVATVQPGSGSTPVKKGMERQQMIPNNPLDPPLEAPLIVAANSPSSPAFESASGISEILASYCRPNLKGTAPCRPGAQLSLLSTKDAEETLTALLEGRANYAIVQADLLYDAIRKQKQWINYPVGKLRAIATLYVSALTVLASDREGLGGHVTGGGALKYGEPRPSPKGISVISSITDLEGRRVSVRHTNETLARSNAITLFNRETFMDWLWKLALVPDEPPPLSSARLFTDGTIVAIIFTSPHPVSWVETLMKRNADSHILPVTGLERNLEGNPQLARALIDVSVYDDEPRGRRMVPTIGIPVILVTTTEAPDWQVEMILSTLIAEAATIGKRYPILNHLALDFMQNTANIEQHNAAEAFYLHAGMAEKHP